MKIILLDASTSSQIVKQLGNIPFFKRLNENQRKTVLEYSELIEVGRGEVIVKEGGTISDFYLLLSGEANIVVSSEEQGEFYDIGTLGAGEFIGELSALLNEPRTATVVAARTCQLMRLDSNNLLELFDKIPLFGFAMSQELARRLRSVIENTNEMVVETTPDSVYMGIPDVSHMRSYMTKYYTTAVKSLFRKHQLLINKKFPRYHVDFSFSKEEQQNWFDLFHVKGTEHQTPFTYFTTSGTMVLMQLVGELGINFKNLRHLKSEITYNAEGVTPACETTYSLQAELDDIVQLREDRVMIITKTMVYDDAMFLVNTNKDFFIILNLEPEYLQVLKSLKNFGRHDSREFQHLSHKETVIAYCPDDIEHRFSIDVPEDMGFQYGKISGDLNMVHTTRMAAKLFGHPKPFIQGLCTANYVLKYLIACGQGPLLNFTITFSQPAFVGETIDIFCSNTAFEVCDSKKKVLAFGNWEKVT